MNRKKNFQWKVKMFSNQLLSVFDSFIAFVFLLFYLRSEFRLLFLLVDSKETKQAAALFREEKVILCLELFAALFPRGWSQALEPTHVSVTSACL